MRINGACHCGAIAFEAEADPNSVRICHCTDCQATSGSLFRANIRATAGTFRLTRGTPKLYVKTAESGNQRAQAFCETCGSGLYSTSLAPPADYVLRVGTIAERASFKLALQAWCGSELPWTADIAGTPRLQRQS